MRRISRVLSVLRRARAGGAKTEANKALGCDANIFFAIGISIPLGNMVASLELEGVSTDPSVIKLLIAFFEPPGL